MKRVLLTLLFLVLPVLLELSTLLRLSRRRLTRGLNTP